MITEDQKAVTDFLASPSAHGGARVERVDTHASVIFLAGDRAYELKRAVRFDYLDSSTRDRRRTGKEKIHEQEKVEQALLNFVRKGNLSTLRELALRAVADEARRRLRVTGRGRDWHCTTLSAVHQSGPSDQQEGVT